MSSRRPSTIGPWKTEEYDTLVNLFREVSQRPRSGNVLSEIIAPTPDDTRPAWMRVRADPLYRKLQRNAGFRAFQDTLRALIQRGGGNELRPRTEFEFLFWALGIAGTFHLSAAKREARKKQTAASARQKGILAYADTRKAARAAIEVLRHERGNGIRLSNYEENDRLFSLLDKLDSELKLKPYKRRETDKTAASTALKTLGMFVSSTFGVSSPKLLTTYADWIGVELHSTNIAKLSSEAHTRVLQMNRALA
jgi:hypothetical protein